MKEEQAYLVSARKYRPSTFGSVVGQGALSSTLKNAIDSGRLAQAYLFCGPRGVGKTSCARIFAKTINCLKPDKDGEACGECESCRAIDRGSSFDLVELDAASNNSVDDIRAIIEQVNVPPQNGKYRVFIIDEVHMLTTSAFNAFLKTLEEPPSNVVFILATTEKHKVIPTILSRCQVYDFKRISVKDIADHLERVAEKEGIKTDHESLGLIALKADGAMRDALSIFDHVAASSNGDITYEKTIANLNILDSEYYHRLVNSFKNLDVSEALLIYKEILEKGFDSLFFINGLASYVRDLMVACDERTLPLLEMPDEIVEKIKNQAKDFPLGWYYAALKILNDCDFNYRTATNKRLLVELTLIRLCQLLQPAQRPFEEPDVKTPLRNPVEPPKAVTVPKETQSPRPRSFRINETKLNSVNEPEPKAVSKEENPNKEQSGGDEKPNISGASQNFMDAWREFIDANPTMHILVNAMRGAQPKEGEDSQYIIIVDHPAQVQAFESAMPKLLTFLREKLNNDRLTIKTEINKERSGPQYLTPKEFLKQTVTDNPELGKFLAEIEAEII